MKKLILIIFIFVSSHCSFDNKSGIWKNNNTYTYYGEVYVSNLTGPEISKIQDCLDTGKWTSSFDKLKHICVDLGIVRF